jgi:hypothetical protein
MLKRWRIFQLAPQAMAKRSVPPPAAEIFKAVESFEDATDVTKSGVVVRDV